MCITVQEILNFKTDSKMSLSEESSLLNMNVILLGYLALMMKALPSFETSASVKVQFKEVKNTTSLLSVVMLLIE
jgi:uncharacterized membrane protein